MLTSQEQVRSAFWMSVAITDPMMLMHRGKRQNDCPTDIRCAFVDFVDALARSGEINEKLAQRVTL